VTDSQSKNFVPSSHRIAIFDNDGTLWTEQPLYIQGFFTIARLRQLAQSNPQLSEQPQYQAALKNDLEFFSRILSPTAPKDNLKPLLKLVFDSHSGMPQDEFTKLARTFLENEKHPRFGRPFADLTYKPMVELIRFLGSNDFKVFIASGGGMSFLRSVSEEIYALPRERMIGSNIAFETKMTPDGPVIFRKPGIVEPIDDGVGKPVNIELHIGRKPVFAVGNSDGDLPMLWLAEKSGYPHLSMIVQHDDEEREYSYALGAERVDSAASERGWVKISMKNDWRTIF
jgi:phosphoserine phosphatase